MRLVRSSKESTRAVAARLGINDKTLNEWVLAARNAEIDPSGAMSDSAKRKIRELEAENARLRKELDFEKKVGSFISMVRSRNDSQ